MSLEVGTVREGKGGKRYTYVGGDEKSKDAWKEVSAAPEKQGFGSKVLAGLETANEGAKFLNKLNPLAFASSKVAEAVSPENAYDIGGKVTDVTGSPELGYAANVGTQAIPSILSGNIVKSASESILKPAGRMVMQSAVKPSSQNLASGNAAKAVETLLKEGKNVTPGGMAAMGKEVAKLSGEVDDMIAAAGKAGVTVNKVEAAKRIKDALTKFSEQVDSKADVATIRKTLNNFLNHQDLKALDEIPIELAQKMKSGTYSILGSKPYGEVGGAATEAQKALARGLKEEIEKKLPGVIGPNKRMGELLNTLEVTAPRVAQSGNKNIGGLAPMASDPVAAGLFMLDRSELFKSILGRLLYSGAPSVLGNAAKGATAIGLGAAQED
jgi:hypothetical protein